MHDAVVESMYHQARTSPDACNIQWSYTDSAAALLLHGVCALLEEPTNSSLMGNAHAGYLIFSSNAPNPKRELWARQLETAPDPGH